MRPRKVMLLVIGNPQELSVLKFMLKTNGYRVLDATSGQQAIALFSEEPQIDLVLADVFMPDMNGKQLVERLKRIAPYIPMILLGDPEAMQFHIADAMLAKKSTSPVELLERIRVMAQRKRGPRKGTPRVRYEQPSCISKA